MKRFLVAVLALLAGVSLANSANASSEKSLNGNSRLPFREIERVCEPTVWRKIKDLDFAGYVVLEGRLDDNGRVKIRKTTEQSPDDSRNQRAVALGNKVYFKGANSASRIPQRATVYVIFFENLHDGGNLALVFGKQAGGSSEANVGGTYLNTVPY